MTNHDQSYNSQFPTTPMHDVSPALPACLCGGGDGSQRQDLFKGVYEYINQMLMEEDDLEKNPCMLNNSLALQAKEQSLYNVLNERPPTSHPASVYNHNDHENVRHATSHENICGTTLLSHEAYQTPNQPEFEPIFTYASPFNSNFQPTLPYITFLNHFDSIPCLPAVNYSPSHFVGLLGQDQENVTDFATTYNNLYPSYMNYGEMCKEDMFGVTLQAKNIGGSHSSNKLSGKRILYQERSSNKQDYLSCSKKFASYSEDLEQLIRKFDKMLLCADMNPHWEDEFKASSSSHEAKYKLQITASNGGRAQNKKKVNNKTEVVDLRSLLLQCSQAVTNNNISAADELIREIRQHSSPYGDFIQRLAYYFVNAIEARLAGTGTSLYRSFSTSKIFAAQILKSYELFFEACPFQRMSNIFANKSIGMLALGRDKLHIIDFGILYGFQWPCIIQGLSLFPGGPPKLKITGIDLPKPGLRPAEDVEATGRHLAKFCKRFNVPFEYNAIAKEWENIQIEDLKVDKDEVLVVNSIYRLRSVPDETVVESGPRDKVLNMIKNINPDLFVLGVLNGTHGGPFFLTRFREALFHFSSLFDMFEATMPREDKNRLLFEQEVFGREAMNVIACEGTSRVERPESYKKWKSRNVKAGFKQLPLDQNFVEEVRAKVKLQYHKDFLVDEDSNWFLQGWKGRTLYGLSLWKPARSS